MEEEGISASLMEIDQTILEDIQQMSQTKMKLDEFEEKRREFTDKLSKLGLMSVSCPEKEKELNDIILLREKEIQHL